MSIDPANHLLYRPDYSSFLGAFAIRVRRQIDAVEYYNTMLAERARFESQAVERRGERV